MSVSSILTLLSAARDTRRQRRAAAAEKLNRAIDRGAMDHRLVIQAALATDDYTRLIQLAQDGKGGGAAWLFPAIDRAQAGDFQKAEELARNALDLAPDNMTAQALHALARFHNTKDVSLLKSGAPVFPHASLTIQALTLLAVEKEIIGQRQDDRGAPEREDSVGGALGWILNRLDDLAIWIYWLLSVALNLFINAFKPDKRGVYWHVIEGDRLEGLGRRDRAAQRFAQALEMAPDCVEALESMMTHSMVEGRYKDAEEYYARLAAVVGLAGASDPSMRKWEADLAFFQGKYDEARTIYENLQPQFPLSYIIPYRIGFCALAANTDSRDHQADRLARGKFQEALNQVNPGLLQERVALLCREAK